MQAGRSGFAGIVLGALLVPPGAAAQPAPPPEVVAEAQTLFERGTRLMQNENWEMALVEFQRSLELYPTRSALFDLAMCEKALHRYRASLAHFDEWAERYDAAATEEERRTVAAAREELRQYVGMLLIRTVPDGATVRVDDEEVGTTPLAEPLAVDIGRHRVEAALDGFEPAAQEAVVTPLDTVTVEVVLTPRSSVEPSPPSGSPLAGDAAERGEEGLAPAWFWTAASAAVAAGIGGAVAGGLVLSDEDELEDLRGRCATGEVQACDDGRALVGEYDDTRLAANVLLPAAGALAATALVLAFFTEFDADGDEEPPAVQATVGPAGAGPSGAPTGLVLGVAVGF
jgi:hypothetical protein